MEEIKFRTLNPEDIDIRVGQRSDKFTMFLLYKNARVDMNILDETVGQQNWSRDHKELKGNLFCGVGIEVAPGKTIWKWDCGTESNTEKEKGEASDSFKRACVNWGIGRELYSSPRVRIWNTDLEWNGNYLKHDLEVQHIAYDESRRIKDLTIIDSETLEVKWQMVNGEIKAGVGAKNTRKPATKRAAGEQTQPQPEAPQRVAITGDMVRGGKCGKILQYLAAFDIDDDADYKKGLQAVTARYDITPDGHEELRAALQAIKNAKAARA